MHGAVEAVFLWGNGEAWHFLSLGLYLKFESIKMHLFSKQSILSHKLTVSTGCHHSVFKVVLNFWQIIIIERLYIHIYKKANSACVLK